jgi:SAM-dependent methyltransferase
MSNCSGQDGLAISQAMDQRQPLATEHVLCCICKGSESDVIGSGADFEYATCPDTFTMVQCRRCGLIYLNPRPTLDELGRIYPSNYHAFEFSEERFGFVYRVRRRLESRRALAWCEGLGNHARILDVGCGDGFHLRLLRDFGNPSWQLEGVDADIRAVEAARAASLTVHKGFVEELDLPVNAYDLVMLIATIEHVDDPRGILSTIRPLLRPGGRVVIVTDNTQALRLLPFLAKRYWGGYHFPRHWNLFNPDALRALAQQVGLEVKSLTTVVTPVNWVYSIRNALVDLEAPSWLSNRFSLESPVALAIFTVFDIVCRSVGYGGLIRAALQRPAS